MKKLFPFLRPYRKESILAPLFKLLEALMDLIVPLVIADIIDRGIANGDKVYILERFIFLLLLAAVGLAFSITAQWFAAKASVGFATDLRQKLFDHIQSLSYSRVDTLGTDTLITRMTSDMNTLQNGVNMVLRLLLRSPFIVLGAMVCSFFIDVKSALVFVVAIPILSLVIYGLMALSIPLYRKVQAKLDRVLGLTSENLTGVRVIRAFCREEDEVASFDFANEELTHLNLLVGRISALMNPVTYVLINVATVVLIQVGAIRVNAGVLETGAVVAMYNYMAQMIVELIKLANLIVTINRALACGDRVAQVLDINPGMEFPEELISHATERDGAEDNQAASAADAVHFSHVSFCYEGGGDEALTDIEFTAKRGETIGIIGGTGSGKSTLVNLIPRFYDVTEGAVEVDGINVKDYPKNGLTDRIAMVPQKAVLFEGSIRDNLTMGLTGVSDEDLWKALETAQAKEVVEGKDGKLDAGVEQNGRNFSGGQKQRLTIARALARKPEILVLDDSSSALDFATDAALRKAINNLEGDLTVFIVSQRTSSIRNADQILVLDDGKLVGKGSHDELLKTCEVYQEIHASQFPGEEVQA
ncbi:MAG: ABC transporter ATP-binding protein [Lachnospiraceae bacterium]|nr:ABC transporter ATP-binding protein [Lachnospiraceae bacterium]